MLKVQFINVADGDAILVEELDGGAPFRLLVDTGRACLEPRIGSLRLTAAEFLRERKISYIDVLIVTHLHLDHFSGLETLLPGITFGAVYSGFFPSVPERRILPEPEAEKTVRGMIACVNQWAWAVQKLEAEACLLHTVSATIPGLRMTERLTADVICPNETVNAVQRLVWEAMLSGRQVPDDLKYWASKSRNPGSLRVRLSYGGRSLELPGDCYGWIWDGTELEPCDILKVPHHGDRKALTQALVQRLRPSHAVISCGADYIPHKDRPSLEMITLLRQQGTRVWFTDSFASEWNEPNHWRCVEFVIYEDGTIIAPDGRGCGRR